MTIIKIALIVTALYCGAMWLLLAFRTLVVREDHEVETFHLGLCFILALGFLGIIGG